MSALEIIEQIEALPPKERALVMGYVRKFEAGVVSADKSTQYAAPDQSKVAGDKVVKQYEEVFRKLAQ